MMIADLGSFRVLFHTKTMNATVVIFIRAAIVEPRRFELVIFYYYPLKISTTFLLDRSLPI